MESQHRDPFYDPEPSYDPEIQVLCIPDDGSRPYLIFVDAIKYDDLCSDRITASTDSLEKILRYVPNLKSFKKHFSIRYRGLFQRNLDVSNLDPQDYGGPYYVYKCINKEKTGLRRNKYFRKLEDARVYGDMFVFSLEGFDDWERPKFGGMSDFKHKLRSRGKNTEKELLDRMAKW